MVAAARLGVLRPIVSVEPPCTVEAQPAANETSYQLELLMPCAAWSSAGIAVGLFWLPLFAWHPA
jgi:hypothetical protein